MCCKDGDVEGFVYKHAIGLLRDAISSNTLQKLLQDKQELQTHMRVSYTIIIRKSLILFVFNLKNILSRMIFTKKWSTGESE